jgi:hypothetical protein
MNRLRKALREHFSHKRLVELTISQYIPVRQTYYDAVHNLVNDYLTTPGTNYRSYQSNMRKATVAAYIAAAKTVTPKSNSPWLKVKIALVLLFVVKLWDDLWQIKQGREQTAATAAEAEQIAITHAENYARGLDGVWSEAMVREAGDIPLLFDGIDGKPPEFPCVTCDSLKGQVHPASWWAKRNLIPYQGNKNYACGCWGCKHGLFDEKGIQYTL